MALDEVTREDSGEEEEEESPEDRLLAVQRSRLRGMLNIGNTCYLNSGVQVVANCEVFSYLIQECGVCVSGEVRKERLLGRWRQLLESIVDGSSTPINPTLFWREVMGVNTQFVGFGQQDSHEFITALIAALDDVLRLPQHVPSLLTSVTHTPTDPASSRQLSLLRYLDNLFTTNIKLDQLCSDRVARRKGKLNFSSGAYYPKIYHSPVTDLFQGRISSSVTCRNCTKTGSRVEPFTCLALEMPTSAQIRAIREASREDNTENGDSKGGVLYNTYVMMSGLVRSLLSTTWGFLGGYDEEGLTLEECLAAHCKEEIMCKSNKYECPHCDGLQDAEKKLNFIELPEYLVINFKRWDHSTGMWTRKINNHVSFPLDWTPDADAPPEEVLDMAPYMAQSEDVPLPPNTTYTLTGLVVHRGSYTGGHYVSYVLKKGMWVLCNDSQLERSSKEIIACEQAYILVYKRQGLAPDSEERLWDKEKAASYLESLDKYGLEELSKKIYHTVGAEPVFISKAWLVKCALACEAGLIPNKPFHLFDAKEAANLSPAMFRSYYCPITPDDWEHFSTKYGGGPKITVSDYQSCAERADASGAAAR